MTELEILEKIAATTDKPAVRAKTEKLIAAMKAHKARQDGKRSTGGCRDKVFVKVQRAGDKLVN